MALLLFRAYLGLTYQDAGVSGEILSGAEAAGYRRRGHRAGLCLGYDPGQEGPPAGGKAGAFPGGCGL